MGLLLLLMFCILAVDCTTTSAPQKVPSHLSFFLRGCNDADMLAMAAFVLQDINNDLKEGYTMSLNRVSAVQEHRQASDNPLSGAGICTSCIDQPGDRYPGTYVGRCFPNWKPAEKSLLPSAGLYYMLLLLIEISTNSANSVLLWHLSSVPPSLRHHYKPDAIHQKYFWPIFRGFCFMWTVVYFFTPSHRMVWDLCSISHWMY